MNIPFRSSKDLQPKAVAEAVTQWWWTHLSPESRSGNALRAALRTATDQSLMLEDEIIDLLRQVEAAREREISLGECLSVLALARLIGAVRTNGKDEFARQLSKAHKAENISSMRLRAIVSAKDEAQFASAVKQILPLLGHQTNVLSITHLFTSWKFDDARRRFAFDLFTHNKN